MLERCQAKASLVAQVAQRIHHSKCRMPAWTLRLDAPEESLVFLDVHGACTYWATVPHYVKTLSCISHPPTWPRWYMQCGGSGNYVNHFQLATCVHILFAGVKLRMTVAYHWGVTLSIPTLQFSHFLNIWESCLPANIVNMEYMKAIVAMQKMTSSECFMKFKFHSSKCQLRCVWLLYIDSDVATWGVHIGVTLTIRNCAQ